MSGRVCNAGSAYVRRLLLAGSVFVIAAASPAMASAQDAAGDSVRIAIGAISAGEAGETLAMIRRHEGGVIIVLDENRATPQTMGVALLAYRAAAAQGRVISEAGFPVSATAQALGTYQDTSTVELFAQMVQQPRLPLPDVGLVRSIAVPPSLLQPRDRDKAAPPSSRPETRG